MNLTDSEILELNELCDAVVEGTLTPAQQARLNQWLASSEPARQFYVRYTGLSASLFGYASEMQAEHPDRAGAPARNRVTVLRWAFGALAAAALVALAFWLGVFSRPAATDVTAESDAEEFVARLTGAKDCQWAGATAWQPGEHLRRGQRIELAKGVAEITFDCGAQITLEGPATLELNSEWDATLHNGTLKASVPHEAIGFRISNPSVEVVDLGTEFSMVANQGGATEVYVLKGAVQTALRDASGREHEPVVLREDQARRFSSAGATDIADAPAKIQRLAKPVKLERITKPAGYVHWSFDELDGRIAHAETSSLVTTMFDATMESAAGTDPQRSEGRWGRALQFDGRFAAQAPFPGIAAYTSRTVAFWIKLPTDSQLSDAHSMVAWIAKSTDKSGPQAMQIGWNSDPTLGALGALRTDFGRVSVVGSTTLRDGQWHHIAVVFAPKVHGPGPARPKQYVDGHLEGAVAKNFKKRHHERLVMPVSDVVWLGRPLGYAAQGADRFRGEMDELFIADRALAPQEIKRLLTDNKLTTTEMARADAQ